MYRTRAIAVLLLLALSPLAAISQTRIDADINAKIRKEGMDNSQIMKTLHFFTDVYGPRLTGSPNHKAAAEWAVKQMTAWGLDNAHLEPWDALDQRYRHSANISNHSSRQADPGRPERLL